jgi:hypothetical protein
MSHSLSKAVRGLETRVQTSRVTRKQRAIVAALREVGATKAADTIEMILDQQAQAVTDGMETVRFMKRVKPGAKSSPSRLSQRP